MNSARQAFKSWMLTSYEERLKIVENFSQQLSQNQELLSSTISKEIGKPHWEADSEVQAMIAKIKISQQAYQERTGSRTQKLNSATAITG